MSGYEPNYGTQGSYAPPQQQGGYAPHYPPQQPNGSPYYNGSPHSPNQGYAPQQDSSYGGSVTQPQATSEELAQLQEQGYAPQPGYVPQPHPPVTLYYGYTNTPQYAPGTAYPDSGDSAAQEEDVIEKPQCRDPCCAGFFLLGIVAFFAVIGWALTLSIKDIPPADSWQFDAQSLTFLGIAMASALVGSAGMLFFIQSNAKCMIWAALLFNACAWIAVGAMCIALGQIWGIVFFFLGGILLLYPFCLRDRIRFVAIMVKYSSSALIKYPGVFALAIGLAVLVIGANGLGGAAMTRVATHYSKDSTDNTPTIIIIGIFSLVVWMCEFIRYYLHTIVAGVVGTFWYMPNQAFATAPSLKRASTTSLGSIAFAALIVTICTVCRTIARMKWDQLMKGKGGGKNQGALIVLLIVVACIACLFSCFEKALRWINHYALVHCSLYGVSFVEGGKRTMETFFQTGFMMIIQKDLTGFVIAIGVLLATAASAGCTFLISWYLGLFTWDDYNNKGERIALLVAVGALLCAYTAHTILTPLQSAVTTTFVCWSEDGAALEQNHAGAFHEMSEARNKIFSH